jgi:hypothetical protein
MGSELKVFVIAAFACACAVGAFADEHVGRNLERGEPARWFQPDDTPQKRAQTAKKEAQAALDEALKECRRERGQRRACEKEARDQYRVDMRDAHTTR